MMKKETFEFQLVINDLFHLCTTTVSPRRVHQVLKIKMERMLLDHHIVVVVVMIMIMGL